MAFIRLAKVVCAVEFGDYRITPRLEGVKAHGDHVAVTVLREDDGIAALHIVRNLRELVSQVEMGLMSVSFNAKDILFSFRLAHILS